LTKNPVKATGAHISIVGHITTIELKRNLEETETANGFANRFLWVFTKRSKYLPEGGNLKDSDFNTLIERLHRAVTYARMTGELRLDASALPKWIDVYPRLSDGYTGLLGSVTSRAEAQVKRIACIYALLDCSESIRLDHLEAALAVWQYCEDSARYIFGEQTGDRIADVVYVALLEAKDGLTRTKIRDLFQRNESSARINGALTLLLELGRVRSKRKESGGKPAELFIATVNDINDQSG
jgi:hypothetical protein